MTIRHKRSDLGLSIIFFGYSFFFVILGLFLFTGIYDPNSTITLNQVLGLGLVSLGLSMCYYLESIIKLSKKKGVSSDESNL